MAGRDDFSSNSKSPGGWGGSGSGGFGGGGGAKSSGSVYNYSSGAGQRGPAIGNWNTGGPVVARGNQFGTRGVGFPGGLAGRVQGGLLGPVVQPPVIRPPVPTSLPPAVTQEDIPGVVQPPSPAPFTGFTDAMMFRDAYEPARNRQWGQYATRPGTYPGQTGSNTTTIYKNPNGGGYTNIPKNNQGNLAGYPGGNQSTYAGMGSDFRSIDSW